jgi:predicted CopG family antitoxin
LRDHKVVNMPRAGEGRSIRIDPEVYEALLTLKRGNMTFSDVIARMLHDCYGWSDDFPANQRELEDFIEITSR